MIVRAFGAEERQFVLRVKQWRDLEKERNCGLGIIAQRLAPLVQTSGMAGQMQPGMLVKLIAAGGFGDARLDDVRDTLVQGLIGGGLNSTDAGALVRKVFDDDIGKAGAVGPVFRWAGLALEILTGAMIGLPDEEIEQPGEPRAAARRARRSKTARPASSSSMAPSA